MAPPGTAHVWTCLSVLLSYPDSKVHGANMGPIWGRQDPGGSHVGPINFAFWVALQLHFNFSDVCIPEVDNIIADTISRLYEPGKYMYTCSCSQ